MSDPISVYLHIPFCASKCPYCDFFSGKASRDELDHYTEQLGRKISLWAKRIGRPAATVYFGGGTPSILGSERLTSLLENVKTSFGVTDGAEITVEVNPDSGRSLDFERLRHAGFNRVSVGLQSADARELQALGRIHTADNAVQTIRHARSAGFHNLSLDVMMGVPYQTVGSLRTSIDFCAALEVTHISSYLLKIEDGTPFADKQHELPLADDDKQAELYLFAVEYLEKQGYHQYEISNFAKTGFESRHNGAYWTCADYIGIGPSAHSLLDGKRFYYGRDLQAFYNDILISDGSGGGEEEFILLSLRLAKGLVFKEYEQRFQKPLAPSFLKQIESYAQAGWMELDERHAAFTPRGFLVSNTILSRLL